MTISSPVSPEAEKRLRSELKPAEWLIWSGQPLANRGWQDSRPYVLGGFLVTAFSVLMAVVAISLNHGSNGMSVGLSLFGAPIILTGLWMLSMPYWMWRKAKKTVYAITDTRAFILSPAWRGGIWARSIAPE